MAFIISSQGARSQLHDSGLAAREPEKNLHLIITNTLQDAETMSPPLTTHLGFKSTYMTAKWTSLSQKPVLSLPSISEYMITPPPLVRNPDSSTLLLKSIHFMTFLSSSLLCQDTTILSHRPPNWAPCLWLCPPASFPLQSLNSSCTICCECESDHFSLVLFLYSPPFILKKSLVSHTWIRRPWMIKCFLFSQKR